MALSRAIRWLVDSEVSWLKNFLIKLFCFIYKPNLEEAKYSSPEEYRSFNDFFARPLQAHARPLSSQFWVCPADGCLVDFGTIKETRFLSIKGSEYKVAELLGCDDERARSFSQGTFSIFYLSPKDYHRVHTPCLMLLQELIFMPGSFYPVNEMSSKRVSRLYARNQRLTFCGQTSQGRIALIMVGALFVSTIVSVHRGAFRADHRDTKKFLMEHSLAKGRELGHFRMGSSVIILTETQGLKNAIEVGSSVKMGEALFS